MQAISDVADKGAAYYAYFFQAKRGRSRFRKQASVWGGEDDAHFETAGNAVGVTRL